MIVYLDVIFLMNVLIDGGLLWVTARARRLNIRWLRLLSAAVIGGVYTVCLFFPAFSFLYSVMLKIIFSLLMLLAAFGFGGLQHYIRNAAAFYAVNFAAAGAVLGINLLRESSDDMAGWIIDSRELDVQPVMAAFGLSFGLWLFLKVKNTAKRKQDLTQYMARVEVFIEDFASSCTGLIDTGNQLYDPLTKTPVMVMEAAVWRDKIPEEWLKKLKQSETDQIVAMIGTEESCFAWQDRLRLVPYRGVNRGTQFMLAIKPDRVVITSGEQQYEASKVLIGLDGGKLSSDEAYQAIIHPSLVQA